MVENVDEINIFEGTGCTNIKFEGCTTIKARGYEHQLGVLIPEVDAHISLI